MAYGCDEFDFGGLEGVVVGNFDVKEPAASFIGSPLHALHDCRPMKEIAFYGRKLLEAFVGIFGIVFEFTKEALGDGDDGGGHCECERGVRFGFEAFGCLVVVGLKLNRFSGRETRWVRIVVHDRARCSHVDTFVLYRY